MHTTVNTDKRKKRRGVWGDDVEKIAKHDQGLINKPTGKKPDVFVTTGTNIIEKFKVYGTNTGVTLPGHNCKSKVTLI